MAKAKTFTLLGLALAMLTLLIASADAQTRPPVTVSPTVVGGQYNTAAPTLLNKQYAPLQFDVNGNLKTTGGGGGGGGSVTQGTVPWVDDITQWANVTLGAPTAWGVAPTGNMIGVNANVLNSSLAVTGTFWPYTLGQQVAGSSVPVVLPSAQITALTPPTTVAVTQSTSPWVISGALTANQSVNVAQFGGISTSTGQVAVSTTPVTATNTALVVDLRPDSPGIITLGPAAVANSVPFTLSSQYPTNATTTTPTAITGNAAGSTAAVVGTLAAASGKTTFICGFNVQALGGTASVGPITIAGLVGSSQIYQTVLNSATLGQQVASATFSPCIPASSGNTAITITTTADGTATAVDVNSWGYQL